MRSEPQCLVLSTSCTMDLCDDASTVFKQLPGHFERAEGLKR